MANIYDVAHIQRQGVDLIIVPMGNNFHHQTEAQKNQFSGYVQQCASSAGLAGTVVVVWTYNGGFYFLAPRQFAPFFQSIDMGFVMANINRQITCI